MTASDYSKVDSEKVSVLAASQNVKVNIRVEDFLILIGKKNIMII